MCLVVGPAAPRGVSFTERVTRPCPAGRAVLVSAAVLLGIPVAFAAMLLTTYGVIFVVHGIGLLV